MTTLALFLLVLSAEPALGSSFILVSTGMQKAEQLGLTGPSDARPGCTRKGKRSPTIYVPVFENRTFYRGLEFDLTKALVREIEARTPYRVVADSDQADIELVGKITSLTKVVPTGDQENQQAEIAVECTWKRLRTATGTGSQPSRPTMKFQERCEFVPEVTGNVTSGPIGTLKPLDTRIASTLK